MEAYRKTGGTAVVVAASETAYAEQRLRALIEDTPAATRLLLSDALIARISQVATNTGILAVVRTPQPRPLPESVADCLMLEGMQDPGNLGSILRSAVAAGIRRVFLSPRSVFAWAPKVVRAGQGAHFSLAIHENAEPADIAQRARGKVIATDPHAKASLFDADLRGPVAWLFGSEGAGLSAPTASLATERVRIPMPGGVESLNVAAAAAICLFEQVRQNADRSR